MLLDPQTTSRAHRERIRLIEEAEMDSDEIVPVRQAFDALKAKVEAAIIGVDSNKLQAALVSLQKALLDLEHDELTGGVEAVAAQIVDAVS